LDAAQITAHNEAVAELWRAYGQRENARVPISFATDEAVWLHLTGRSFRDFYLDPAVQLQVQLEGQAWWAETIVHDQPFGPPAEAWTVAPRFWMEEPEYFGCEVVIQEDSFAWAKPLTDSKADLLHRLAGLDPVTSIKQGQLWRLYTALRELTDGLVWRDLPVRLSPPGGGTNGIFTVACHVRGAEALCLDLAEDPDFAREVLGIITEKTIARITAWHELAATGATLPLPSWGMADDSVQFISPRAYVETVLPSHERIYAAMTTGARSMHLCGHSQQHFAALYHQLGIRLLDGPGPFVDWGALLETYPGLSINAQADHTRLLLGPCEDIRQMLREALTEGARQPGRLQVMGFLAPQTPLSHLRCMYEAGRELGRIG
jgi:hypothetical protein